MMDKRRNEVAHHAEAGGRGESRWGGTRAAGRGTREALAAKLQHACTGKLEGMEGREQGCVSEFAEQRYEESEVAQNMHQTFQAGSGKQPLQHTGDKSSADASGPTACTGKALQFSGTKGTEIAGFARGSCRHQHFGADHGEPRRRAGSCSAWAAGGQILP